ncbi:MAG: ABC transporter substrate-binding protein [Paenibacillaceae bacterium]|jgi:chorismate dehydratase|nr:MAG: ABC transporter substrate-binding protein [Paenibacillaceae bacterium]
MAAEREITVGRIDYANIWPIFDRFEECLAETGVRNVRVAKGVPATLNRALSEGTIDIAAISSFAYGQRFDEYELLPELSVSADGEVMSVLLFLKRPLEEALRGRIAVTTASATSVNLLRIVMQGRYGRCPELIAMEPDLEAMLERADGALLIGDPAIRASWRPGPGIEVLDAARMWKEWTGLGMTFAVFAVRREAAREAPETVRRVYEALAESKRRALADIEGLSRKAAGRFGGGEDYWERYFRTLRYGFGPQEQEGLSYYYDCAFRMGLLERRVAPVTWPDHAAARVNE